MKSTLRLLIIIVLILGVFGEYTTASAAEVIKGTTITADAYFSSLDNSGCILTQVYAYSLDSLAKNPPGPGESSSFAYVSIQKYDICSGFTLMFADGLAWLDDAALEISKKHDQASLNATINLYDWVSQTSWDVYLDLNWTGTGSLLRERHQNQYVSPGCHLRTRATGMSREAEASGTISDGSTNFAPDPSSWASIFSAKTSEVYVGCN